MSEALDEYFSCPATRRLPFEACKLPHLKIQGRGAGKLRVIESYMYYLIKPECRDEVRSMFMHNLERNGVVKIDNI